MKNSQDQSLWAVHLTHCKIANTVANPNHRNSIKFKLQAFKEKSCSVLRDSLAFNKYLLSIYPVPSTIQGSGDIAINLSQNRSHHALLSLSTSWIPWHNSILFISIKKDILLYPSKTKNSWFPGVMFYKAAANSETRTMDPCS